MGLCRLCLNHSQQFIDIFSEHGRSLNISPTIVEFFRFEIFENDVISTTICQQCWGRTSEFQQFHSSVKTAQDGLFRKFNLLDNDRKPNFSQFFDTSAGPPGVSVVENIGPLVSLESSVTGDERHEEIDILDIKLPEPECKLEMVSCSDDDDSIEDTADSDSDYEPEPKLNTYSPRKSKQKPDKDESSSEDEVEPSSKSSSSQTKKTPSKRAVNDARIRSVFNINCTLCSSADFQTFNDVSRHYEKEHNTPGFVMCCDRKIKTRIRLLEHIEYHINPNVFQCDICKSSFQFRLQLKRHIETHMTDEQKAYKCDKCPKRYPRLGLLNRHILDSHGSQEDKKFGCPQCDKKYLSKGKLSSHIKQTHDCVSVICDVCGKDFKSIYVLNTHRKEVHFPVTDQSPDVQCHICDGWIKKKSYKKHLKRHTADVAKCTVCGKEMLNKHSLGNHMRYVHGERMHQCQVCDKSFSKPLSLREHMALHTGQDLYTCPYCPKTFKSGANMHAHRKKFHFEDWEKDRGKQLATGKYP